MVQESAIGPLHWPACMIRSCNLSGQPVWYREVTRALPIGQPVQYRKVPWAHSIGQPVPYGYNFNPAIPFHTATIKPRPDLGWPVWIALLSSWVARVVRGIPLNGLVAHALNVG